MTPAASGRLHSGRLHVRLTAALIEACGRAGQLPRAMATYRDFEARRKNRQGHRQGLPPLKGNPHNVAILPATAVLKACEAAGALEEGFRFLAEMRHERGVTPGAGMLTPLLRGCARASDLQRALQLLDLARELRVEMFNSTVREFALAGPLFLKDARRLHMEAVEQGAKMSKGSTAKLVAACLAAGDQAGAHEVLSCGDGGLDQALDVLYGLARQQRQRDAIEFNTRRPEPR